MKRTSQINGRQKRKRPLEYVLRLYITGATPRSARALKNVKALCEGHLRGRYALEIVDVYQQPTLAKGDQVIAIPTLIKRLPLPLRTFIGDMSQEEKILAVLDVRSTEEAA